MSRAERGIAPLTDHEPRCDVAVRGASTRSAALTWWVLSKTRPRRTAQGAIAGRRSCATGMRSSGARFGDCRLHRRDDGSLIAGPHAILLAHDVRRLANVPATHRDLDERTAFDPASRGDHGREHQL